MSFVASRIIRAASARVDEMLAVVGLFLLIPPIPAAFCYFLIERGREQEPRRSVSVSSGSKTAGWNEHLERYQ